MVLLLNMKNMKNKAMTGLYSAMNQKHVKNIIKIFTKLVLNIGVIKSNVINLSAWAFID